MGENAWGSRKYHPGQFAQRTRVLKRDPICRCTGCAQCSTRGCFQPSTNDDHIVPLSLGGNADVNDDTNHAGMCHSCHARKSSQEAAKARKKITNKHPLEKHPGLI